MFLLLGLAHIVLSLFALQAAVPHSPAQSTQARAQKTITHNPHGPLAIPCENCHTYTSWKPIRSTPEFDHDKTRYPLRGLHEKVSCIQCHVKPVFKNVGQRCADCHADLHRGQFGANCESCHTVKGWNVQITAIRDHQNRFPLIGAHAAVDCDSCHKDGATGQFKGLSTECYSCHSSEYLSSSNPSHIKAHFAITCQDCHNTNNWLNAKFDHSTSGFPLTGAHVTVPCASCHINNNYNLGFLACSGCHLPDYQKSTQPNHVQLGLPTTCEACHTTTAWQPATFDHTAFTKFPLTGAHISVPCASCHINGQFAGTPTNCVGCHLKDFNGAKTPDHVKGGLPQTCESCHTTTAWQPASFDHAKTGFTLTGAHVSAPCTSCHVNGNYKLAATICSGCHMEDFQHTSKPNHKLASIPTTCDVCHTTTAWEPAIFDHSKTTFPLTGAHVSVACATCHVNGNFTTLATNCVGCHLNDFNGAKKPDHVKGGFPQTCESCHTTTAWQPASFDHNKTGFPLTGAHVSTPCSSCHVNGNYKVTNTTCVSCHLPDFDGAKNPDHVKGGIPQACQDCHTTTAWQPAKFDHSKTGFPLTGAHEKVACASCHINNNYNLTATACVACHLPDFNGAKSPDHVKGGLPQTCEVCHTTTAWQPASFDHSKTGFTLTGAHVKVACSSCHLNNNYKLTETACVACHLADFKGAKAPDHMKGGLPQTCEVCHTTTAWQPAKFDHSKTGFPLTGAHVSIACVACHINNNYGLTATACAACHLPDFKGAKNPDHVKNGIPQTCEVCHTTIAWQPANFDHSKTGFPLTGAHVSVACSSCHINNNYNLTTTACVACHQKDFNGAKNPDHVKGGFPQACEVCHTTTAWQPANFDHNNTGFPLTGAHTSVACASCHINGNYNLTATACSACHLPDFQKTTSPNHVKAGLPTTCEVCHTTTAWQPATFDHSKTAFPLTGAHVNVVCATCHVNNNFTTLPTNCVGCHLPDFNGAKNPDHVKTGIPQTCEVCHTTTAWQPANFDHNKTGFPLTGFHTTVACTACHINNNYNLTNTACVACHLPDFNGAKNPDHVKTGIPQTCEVCHTTTAWQPANFDHSKTGFPLTGFHTTVACTACHINNNYTLTNTACVGCHQADYNGAKSPNHVQGGFPVTCDSCHTTTAWQPANFDHSKTGFPLTGFHTTVPCTSCHINNNYNLTNTACIACHLPDFNGAKNPDHVKGGFPRTCEVCHSTTAWQPANFDHSKTGFPLTGFHVTVVCASCHINNNYNLSSAACVACHLPDYNGAKSPNHVQGGFPQTCDSCHTTTAWQPAHFDHSKTGFPLTGFHTTVACTACHINNNYSLTSATCVGCHLPDYNGAKSPNHVQGGFPQTCDSCHSTTAWQPANFDHSKTGFPLTGFHTTVACSACHLNNNYNLTNATCVACHLPDYNGAKSPNHVQGGFPQTCDSCHTTTAWQPANFDHSKTGFPLTGFHTTVACSSCHINNNYSLTSATCVGCHLPDYNGAKSPNHVQGGFPQTCDSCHTTTAWQPANFDHSKTGFPLTGFHTTVACTACHINNNYSLTSATCVACHLPDYNGAKSPNHVQGGFPQTCDSCHTTTAWQPANFDHSKTGFPLTGFHTTVACTACHINNNYSLTSATCVACHLPDYNGAKSPNHVQGGFPQTCDSCHTTTAWQPANFDHSRTGFPLTGFHTTVACTSCHINNNYNLTNPACVACHLPDYNSAKAPDHVAGGFPQTCDTCHTTTAWQPATFDHSKTGFALTGFHTTVACALCHVNNNYNLTSGACSTCHLKDYQGTTNPNHTSAGFPTDCSVCHTTTSWLGAVFDHSKTGWPLTGFHTTVACTSCHINNNYNLTSTACVTCHLPDFTKTTNPNHVTSGFPQTCDLCHTTAAWQPSSFDHSKTTFPLTGFHTTVACASCHVNANYTTVPTDCYSCHKADYVGTNNPNHVSAGFPTTCATCHTTTAWTGATFNHTWFPVPHHNATLCTDCHTNSSDYTIFNCTTCHTKPQTDPKHSGVNGYVWNSVNCYQCHKNGGGG